MNSSTMSTKYVTCQHSKLHERRVNVSPLKSSKITLAAPLQSLTTQISDYHSVCAQFVELPKSDKKYWSFSRAIYNNLPTFKSQQKYIENISKHIQMKSIIIMDWDDTVFPTTAFQKLKKQSLTHNFFKFIDEYYDKYPILPGFVKSIDKCISDTYDFMIQQIDKNDCIILIISNGNYQWLNECLSGSHILSNLKSIHNLKKAINDKNTPIRLISAKSEFEQKTKPLNINKKAKGYGTNGTIYKKAAFIKYIKEIKTNYVDHTFCVYCIGDGFTEFKASQIAMNHVFDNDEQFLLIRHKLDIDHKNTKSALQSVIANINSFHCWDRKYCIDMILQHNDTQIIYDIFVD